MTNKRRLYTTYPREFKLEALHSQHNDILVKNSIETLPLSPVIDKYINNDYTSTITGVTSPDWKKESISINWGNAVKLLKDLKPFMKGFKSEYKWVFEEMEEIAANDGTKPPVSG